jgi:hypothetical protein
MSPPSRPDPADKATHPPPEPVRCIVGETVREVRVWTEEEWERLDPARRPSPAEHVPGLGWVAAVSGRRSD